MPQLDLMTFFSQFFWFSLSFSFFYLFLLYYILPTISLNVKFRKRLLNLFAKDINFKKNSISNLLLVYDSTILKVLNFSRLYIVKILFFSDSWLQVILAKLNLNYFSYANVRYIKMISEKDFSFFVLSCLFKSKQL